MIEMKSSAAQKENQFKNHRDQAIQTLKLLLSDQRELLHRYDPRHVNQAIENIQIKIRHLERLKLQQQGQSIVNKGETKVVAMTGDELTEWERKRTMFTQQNESLCKQVDKLKQELQCRKSKDKQQEMTIMIQNKETELVSLKEQAEEWKLKIQEYQQSSIEYEEQINQITSEYIEKCDQQACVTCSGVLFTRELWDSISEEDSNLMIQFHRDQELAQQQQEQDLNMEGEAMQTD